MTTKATTLRLATLASTALLALTGLAGCGASANSTSAATTEAVSEAAATTSTSSEKEPYAYLGFGDIPDNEDLKIWATQHYYMECTYYSSYTEDGVAVNDVLVKKEAADYADSVLKNYTEDGTLDSVYATIGDTSIYADYASKVFNKTVTPADELATKEDYEAAIEANNDEIEGFEFVGKSKEELPIVEDGTEYDCYTYAVTYEYEDENGEAQEGKYTEKMFVDGSHLVARYTEMPDLGDDGGVVLFVYTKNTSEIPDGFLALPDTTGLEDASVTESESESE